MWGQDNGVSNEIGFRPAWWWMSCFGLKVSEILVPRLCEALNAQTRCLNMTFIQWENAFGRRYEYCSRSDLISHGRGSRPRTRTRPDPRLQREDGYTFSKAQNLTQNLTQNPKLSSELQRNSENQSDFNKQMTMAIILAKYCCMSIASCSRKYLTSYFLVIFEIIKEALIFLTKWS